MHEQVSGDPLSDIMDPPLHFSPLFYGELQCNTSLHSQNFLIFLPYVPRITCC